MIEERKGTLKHNITMQDRQVLLITGVNDVLNFDEVEIVAETQEGILIIHGENLHVTKLNLESGELNIDGEIDSLEYQKEGVFSKNKGSLLSRIFR